MNQKAKALKEAEVEVCIRRDREESTRDRWERKPQ